MKRHTNIPSMGLPWAGYHNAHLAMLRARDWRRWMVIGRVIPTWSHVAIEDSFPLLGVLLQCWNLAMDQNNTICTPYCRTLHPYCEILEVQTTKHDPKENRVEVEQMGTRGHLTNLDPVGLEKDGWWDPGWELHPLAVITSDPSSSLFML